QIIKAVLMLSGGTLLSGLVLYAFSFSPDAMLAEAVTVHPYAEQLMAPGEAVTNKPSNALSLGLALAFGTAGLPHILMRFFTVSTGQEGRVAVPSASRLIGHFYVLTYIRGLRAVALAVGHREFFHVGAVGSVHMLGDVIGGTNMAAVHLSNAVGRSLVLGFL